MGRGRDERWRRGNDSPPSGHNAPPRDILLAVVVSRSFANAKLLTVTLEEYLERVGLFISGGADGADQLGARWARKNGIESSIFEPDHKRYRHPYHHRNRLIAEACTLLIAFWDGRSSGTRYTIDYAKRIGREVRVIRF